MTTTRRSASSIPLREACLDVSIFREFLSSLNGTSPANVRFYGTNLRRVAATLGATRKNLDAMSNIIAYQAAEREEHHLPRPLRLVEEAPWPILVRRFLDWDRVAHRCYLWGSIPWALLMMVRTFLWLLFLCGPRRRNLISLRVSGPSPNLLFAASGQLRTLVLRHNETKNRRRIEFPVDLVPGLARLLEVYVHVALPLLRGEQTTDLLFPGPRGPFSWHGLTQWFRRHIAQFVFDGLPVSAHFLRHVCVALLHDGFTLRFEAIAPILGDTVRTVEEVYYGLNMRAAGREWAQAVAGHVADDATVSLVSDLKDWLSRLALDFSRPGAGLTASVGATRSCDGPRQIPASHARFVSALRRSFRK